MTSQSSAAALPVSPAPCSSAVRAARSPFSIPACRATASPAARMACSATITSHRWTSCPRRWQQLARYPTIRLVNARADSICGAIDDFSVLTADGESLRARRLILSYGVVDQMPEVPGFAEGWGTSMVPCTYFDGFEVAGHHWGLVWAGAQSHNHV